MIRTAFTLLALATPAVAATTPPEPASPPGVVLDADTYIGKTAPPTEPEPIVALPGLPEDMRCRWRPGDGAFLWRGDPDFPCSTTRGYVPVVWCPPRGGEPRDIAGGPTTLPERPHVPQPPWFGPPSGEGAPPMTFTPPADPPSRRPPYSPTVIPLPAAGWLLLTSLGGLGFAAWRKTR